MSAQNIQSQTLKSSAPIHWGHFGLIFFTMILLMGATWLKQPDFFSIHKNAMQKNVADVPKYYAYEQPAGLNKPLVAGASTNEGPSVIGEDGTVIPVDMGKVLGASTENVVLSLDSVAVNVIADTETSVAKYFTNLNNLEKSPIDNGEFETALSSGSQDLINKQAEKLIALRDAMQKLSVPAGLVTFHKLKIIQYNAAVGVLQNFTQADTNPQLVGDNLSQFLKSQQDLDNETIAVAKKYNLDPLSIGAISDGLAASGAAQGISQVNNTLNAQ